MSPKPMGRSGQTAMEYLLMLVVALGMIIAVFMFISSSQQAATTSTTQTIIKTVITPNLSTGGGACTPNCAGKECGTNGCGRSCGACTPPETCDASGQCTCTPVAESCDNKDNDCDGSTDEELGTTTCGSGECLRTVDNCFGGIPQTCTPGTPVAESCDNKDNDCDGSTDESLTQSISCGVGACLGTVSQTCSAGAWAPACVPGTPSAEVCNGLDDDCDGTADESGCPGACQIKYRGGDNLHPYAFCTSKKKWADAKTYCTDKGYHLVTIGDASENTWVDRQADAISSEKWWVGLNDIAVEGNWVWESGGPVTYTNWYTGEPNNAGNEDCGQLNRYPDGKWNDGICINTQRFICEVT